MADTDESPPPRADTEEPPPTAAVGLAGSSLGRRLRVLAGVNEKLLAWVPAEQARYTGLGGVVLGTATIAGLSMWIALGEVLGGTYLLAAVPVLIWVLFVLNLDRWIVSSATGTMWRRRAVLLLPRLLVAFVLGIIIAEPIVLRVFQTAIEQQVRDVREQQVADLRSMMVSCNPVPEPATSRPECAGYVVSLAATPAALTRELAGRERDAATLERTVKADTAQHAQLEAKAQQECAGVAGDGLSGRAGVGNRCRRDRADADDFAAAHRISANSARLAELTGSVTELRTRLGDADGAYQRAVNAEIDNRVHALRDTFGPIGLLERLRALVELTAHNGFLLAATWLLRAFLILVDCLPVLVKLIGGTTAYDRLVDRWTSSRERIFDATVGKIEASLIGDVDLEQHEHANQLRKRRQEIDVDRRRHEAGIRASLTQLIDARTADLLAQGQRGEQANGHPRPPDPGPGGGADQVKVDSRAARNSLE